MGKGFYGREKLSLTQVTQKRYRESVVRLLKAYRTAKVPVEVHLYTQGSHGFNMGKRSRLASLQTWPQRMADWLADNNILQPGKYKPE